MDLGLYTGLAALAVVAVEQTLKILPVPFTDLANRYPVATNIVLSCAASIWVADIHWSFANWRVVLGNVFTIAVVAALTYNQLVKPSALKKLETPAPVLPSK